MKSTELLIDAIMFLIIWIKVVIIWNQIRNIDKIFGFCETGKTQYKKDEHAGEHAGFKQDAQTVIFLSVFAYL